MTDSAFATRERFLSDLYRNQSGRLVGLTSVPELVPVYEHPHGDFSVSRKPIHEWVPWAVENYRRRLELAEAMDDDTVPVARLNTGTQIFAAAFGCPVHSFEDSNPCALPLIHTAEEADRVKAPSLWDTPELYRVFELAAAVRDELGPDAWLAPCDMQTGFDIACLIWEKGSLLCAMADPEAKQAVKRLAQTCGRLLESFLLELHREFPRMSLCGCPSVWSPPDLGPWPSNDECGAVSTDMFREFMLPELIRLSRAFGSLGMHCCAGADHQMASFHDIPNFYAFNRVAPPSSGVGGFYPALDALGGADGPVFVIGWTNPEQARALHAYAPEGTRFIFQHVVTDLDNGKRRHEQMTGMLT